MLEANRYWYADCDPTNNTDPTGLYTMTPRCYAFAVNLTSALIRALIPGAAVFTFLLSKAGWVTATAISASGGAAESPAGRFRIFNSVLATLASTLGWIPGWGQAVSTVMAIPALSFSLSACLESYME